MRTKILCFVMLMSLNLKAQEILIQYTCIGLEVTTNDFDNPKILQRDNSAGRVFTINEKKKIIEVKTSTRYGGVIEKFNIKDFWTSGYVKIYNCTKNDGEEYRIGFNIDQNRAFILGEVDMVVSSIVAIHNINSDDKAERERVLAEKEKEERKIREIRSKVYDLKEYAPNLYQKIFNTQRDEIENYFMGKPTKKYPSRGGFPSFSALDNRRKVKFEQFKNTYTALYELENFTRGSSKYRDSLVSLRDIRLKQEFKLVEGTDRSCSFIESMSIGIPKIQIEGYDVMTKATFEFKVDFTRGITVVKIKGGDVKFTKFPPEQDLQPIIIEHLKNNPNGNYEVKYEVGNILGKEIANIQVQVL